MRVDDLIKLEDAVYADVMATFFHAVDIRL